MSFQPEPDDVVEQLLPIEDETLDPIQELAALDAALEATPDIDDLIVQDDEPLPLGKSWAYDYALGRFVSSTNIVAHGPLAVHGLHTLEGWIEKTLRTDRGAHPVHSDAYGIERPFDMIGQPVARGLPDDYPERARRALLLHPHIAAIRRFRVEMDPDQDMMLVSFLVVLLDESALAFETRLGI